MPPNTATASVRITVDDINDNPPIFTRRQYQATIEENSEPDEVSSILANIDVSLAHGNQQYVSILFLLHRY